MGSAGASSGSSSVWPGANTRRKGTQTQQRRLLLPTPNIHPTLPSSLTLSWHQHHAPGGGSPPAVYADRTPAPAPFQTSLLWRHRREMPSTEESGLQHTEGLSFLREEGISALRPLPSSQHRRKEVGTFASRPCGDFTKVQTGSGQEKKKES